MQLEALSAPQLYQGRQRRPGSVEIRVQLAIGKPISALGVVECGRLDIILGHAKFL